MRKSQAILVFVGLIVGIGLVAGQGTMSGGGSGPNMMRPGPMHPGMMGQGMMMPGMMGNSGMMGAGMMSGMGMMQVLPANATPLTDEELRTRLEGAVAGFGAGSQLADVMPFSNHTYAQVLDAEGNGVAEILVDRYTGVVMPEPGPNMMWNPGGMMGPATLPSAQFDAAGAQALAEEFLGEFFPGAEVEAGQAFPGYFTFDYEREGTIVGMLSVNAATGLIWPHVWHGPYLGGGDH